MVKNACKGGSSREEWLKWCATGVHRERSGNKRNNWAYVLQGRPGTKYQKVVCQNQLETHQEIKENHSDDSHLTARPLMHIWRTPIACKYSVWDSLGLGYPPFRNRCVCETCLRNLFPRDCAKLREIILREFFGWIARFCYWSLLSCCDPRQPWLNSRRSQRKIAVTHRKTLASWGREKNIAKPGMLEIFGGWLQWKHCRTWDFKARLCWKHGKNWDGARGRVHWKDCSNSWRLWGWTHGKHCYAWDLKEESALERCKAWRLRSALKGCKGFKF